MRGLASSLEARPNSIASRDLAGACEARFALPIGIDATTPQRHRLTGLVSLVHKSQVSNTAETCERGSPTASSSEPKNRRRLQLLNQQLPAAAKWAASLPWRCGHGPYFKGSRESQTSWPDCGMTTLGYGFTWTTSLDDRRGGRRGFPPEILNELVVLRAYREGRYPGVPPSA